MTREEINVLGLEELETRASEIAMETEKADSDMLEMLNSELDAIEERKQVIQAETEKRKKAMEAVAAGAGKEIEERKEKKMTDREMRSTQEYIDLYAEYVKAGYDLSKVEKRMPEAPGGSVILSENASGMIAVPTYIEDKINTSWERNEILRRVRRTFLPGNVKVGVEVSSDGAQIHQEGGDAITREDLQIAYVNLVPEYVKKLIEVSHTVMALTSRAFLDYLYDEIEYQIVKKVGDEIISAVLASNYSTTFAAAGSELTTVDIVNAEGNLAGDANPVLITTRANAASLKASALGAYYGYDPFDGLDVIYVDAAPLNGNLGIVIDLNAVQANFPEGGEPRFIFDEYTKATENVVRIVGRLLAAVDLVATGKAVVIEAGEGGDGEE